MATILGGKKIDALLRKMAANQKKDVKVGLLKDAKYQDGESVATVAAQNEFGHKGIPARPFFRQSIPTIEQKMAHMGGPVVNPSTGGIRDEALAALGEMAVGEIQESITQLDRPPNSPATIKMKGSSNPLIDTGVMRRSIAYEVV